MSSENNGMLEIIEPLSDGIVETKQELKILVSNEDKYGHDIVLMSNFFDICIQQLTYELSAYTENSSLEVIPFAQLGIINDVVHQAEIMMEGKYGYIPDFENLPHDIKSKLDKGIYKIGESKQVSGNMRAVIMDENNDRIKDITLKRVMNNLNTTETIRSISNQAQMKQINAKLDYLLEMQSYQIDRDRDRDLLLPFFNARDNILRAQEGILEEDIKENLKNAVHELTSAINAVYLDMSTTSEHLVKQTKFPIFQRRKLIKSYIEFLTRDLQLVTRYVGIQMQIFNYLGDSSSSKQVLDRYQHVMQDFFTKGINAKGHSAARLIQLNYPYNGMNNNWWNKFIKDMTPVFQTSQKLFEEKEIYLVSLEDVNDEN